MFVKFKVAILDDVLSSFLINILKQKRNIPRNYRKQIRNVSVIAFDKTTKKIALVVNKVNKHLDDKMSISFPGGKIEENETFLEAAKREFGEEFFRTNDSVFTKENHSIIHMFSYFSTKIILMEYDFEENSRYIVSKKFDNEIITSKLITTRNYLEGVCSGVFTNFPIGEKREDVKARFCMKTSMQHILYNELRIFSDGLNTKLVIWTFAYKNKTRGNKTRGNKTRRNKTHRNKTHRNKTNKSKKKL